MSPHPPTIRRLAALALAVCLVSGLAACTDDPEPVRRADGDALPSCRPESVPAEAEPSTGRRNVTLRLVTHDSFAVSDGTLQAFTAQTGIKVKLVTQGDAGAMVSQAVATAGQPVGDVLYGVDNTSLCRATAAGLFVPYRPRAMADVPARLRQARLDLATPIDVSDVCLNYSSSAFRGDARPPRSLDDLTRARYRNRFVTENPETSSPGMAFLLATIAAKGEDGWEDYWRDLRRNGLKVTEGWTEAYEDEFKAGAGRNRTIVTSYASSPVADVVYSDPPRTTPNIGVVTDACFRQIEFAGILRGTDHPREAARLVDFLLSKRFQEDIPLNMFVSPANRTATIPPEYRRHQARVTDPYEMTPAEIEAGRKDWTERWTEIVLR